MNEIYQAVLRGDYKNVQAHLSSYQSTWRDPEGRSLLFLSALAGRVTFATKPKPNNHEAWLIFACLMQEDPRAATGRDHYHNTLLTAAAIGGHLDIFRHIWTHFPEQQGLYNQNEESALMFAAANGHQAVVRFMLEARPEALTDTNLYGNNLLMFALHGQNLTLIDTILALSPGQLTETNAEGVNPIMTAALMGQQALFDHLSARLLASEQADVWLSASLNGQNLLHHAIRGAKPEIVATVVRLAPDLLASQMDGMDPQEFAEELGLGDLFSDLLKVAQH